MRQVSDGQSPGPTPGTLTRALIAAGVDSELWLEASPLTAGVALPPRSGDYELGRRLGQGGMGTVYAARHIPTGSERALKDPTSPYDE